MAFNDTFLAMNKSPVASWKAQEQEFLNDSYTNASNLITIEKETSFGSLIFTDIIARVGITLDSKVGDKINDDYRTLFFPDISFKPLLGSRFRFFDNIWIVYNVDNVNSLNSSCYVRRCNNTINSLDYYGNIHREPCVIDLKPTKSSFIEDDSMWAPSTRQIIMYQNNQWTQGLEFNSRIMFENQTYRVGVNLNFDRQKTFDDGSVYLTKAYLDLDLVNEYDNKTYQIADYHNPDFLIQVQNKLSLSVDDSGTIPYSVYRNGTLITESVIWESTNESVVSIDSNTGQYNCLSAGTTTITVKLKNNTSYSSTIEVEVSATPQQLYETKIVPNDTYIPLKESVTYQVFEYLNGDIQNTTFSFALSQLSDKYYSYSVTDNSITITNNQQNEDILLKLTIKNNRTLAENIIYIELGGLF